MAKIIVLEESKSGGEALRNALISMGHTISMVQNVPSCLTLLNDDDFDLLITDFFITSKKMTSPISGATVIIAVRFSDATGNGLDIDSRLPIIAMSERVSDTATLDPLELCSALGATGTIRKPVDIPELRRKVDKAMCA